MKIYTRCVYAWQPDGSLSLEESDSYDYEGPIALCKDSPSPPPAPDYIGAAKEQGAANLTSAQQGAVLSNPNINSPYGSQSVSYSPLGGSDPNTSGFLSPYITQSLNPQSQQIFNAQQQAKLGLANLGQQGIGTAQNIMGSPFQFQGPGLQTSIGGFGSVQNVPDIMGMGSAQGSINNPNLQSAIRGYGNPQGNIDNPNVQRSLGEYGSPQGNLDTSGIARMPVNAGTTAQNAIMARLAPQLQRERSQAETQLRNQGLVAGGEAYGNAMTIENQRENDLLNQAALYGLNLDLSANQQGYNQALNTGQFGNQAQQQRYGQVLGSGQFANQAAGQQFGQNLQAGQFGNQAQQQQYGQTLGAGQFANQAAGQQFNQNLAATQMGNQALAQNQQAAMAQNQAQNQAQGQQYNQALQSGQFGNTAQQQAMMQQLYQRNLPLNEITALMSGSQIQNPQFQQYQGQNVAPPPLMNATGQQAQYNQGLYNSQVGQNNAMTSGLFSLGAAAIGASDRRLKSNIVRIGTHPLGIGIYEYNIFGHRDQGVMADEVLTVRPEAVVMHPSGYMMVDYGRL